VNTFIDKLLVSIQYIVPARLLGNLTNKLACSERVWLKNLLIRAFTTLFDINTEEMDREHSTDYPSFNAFFTRELKPGARPIDETPSGICSPADGTIQHVGYASAGNLYQAKGMTFTSENLLAAETADVAPLNDGAHMTIYLAPHNYHRLHAPMDGTLRKMHFIPGRRFSVNTRTANTIPGLFARNERLACQFDGPAGAYWLVFVGAMNVASISTAWAGEIVSQSMLIQESFTPVNAPSFCKGDYIGHFNLGSTIVMLFPNEVATWLQELKEAQPVRVGQKLADF